MLNNMLIMIPLIFVLALVFVYIAVRHITYTVYGSLIPDIKAAELIKHLHEREIGEEFLFYSNYVRGEYNYVGRTQIGLWYSSEHGVFSRKYSDMIQKIYDSKLDFHA